MISVRRRRAVRETKTPSRMAIKLESSVWEQSKGGTVKAGRMRGQRARGQVGQGRVWATWFSGQGATWQSRGGAADPQRPGGGGGGAGGAGGRWGDIIQQGFLAEESNVALQAEADEAPRGLLARPLVLAGVAEAGAVCGGRGRI